MKHTVTEFKLASGAKGLVVNVPNVDVVSLAVYFNSGFIFGDHSKYEVPHVLEHLRASDPRFSIEVEKNGAYNNAFTDNYSNWYAYESAAFEAERILGLAARQLTELTTDPGLLATEVANVREELTRDLSDYGRLAYFNLAAEMMPKAVMREDDRLQQLPAITMDDIVSHSSRTHTAANLRFYVAGDFKDHGASYVAKFEQLIKSMPRGQRLAIPIEPTKNLDEPLILRRPIEQIYYQIAGFVADTSYQQRLGLVVASNLLTGGFGSWLFGKARERGLAYHVASGVSAKPDVTSFMFSAFVTPTNAKELFKLIAESYRRLQAGDFSDQELTAAKQLIVGRATRSHQTAGSLLGWYDSFHNFEDRTLDFEQYLKDIQTVTKSQIQQAANLMTVEQRWGVSLVGNISKSQADSLYQTVQPIWSN